MNKKSVLTAEGQEILKCLDFLKERSIALGLDLLAISSQRMDSILLHSDSPTALSQPENSFEQSCKKMRELADELNKGLPPPISPSMAFTQSMPNTLWGEKSLEESTSTDTNLFSSTQFSST
jgi:hypothetical protein